MDTNQYSMKYHRFYYVYFIPFNLFTLFFSILRTIMLGMQQSNGLVAFIVYFSAMLDGVSWVLRFVARVIKTRYTYILLQIVAVYMVVVSFIMMLAAFSSNSFGAFLGAAALYIPTFIYYYKRKDALYRWQADNPQLGYKDIPSVLKDQSSYITPMYPQNTNSDMTVSMSSTNSIHQKSADAEEESIINSYYETYGKK